MFAVLNPLKIYTMQINPYLTFNGNCSEAMTFYKNCLGGDLILQVVKDSPMANEWPADVQDHILHASLTNQSLVLLGSDMGSSAKMIKGNAISLSLHCTTEEELKTSFLQLSEGGKVTRPLHEFFGGTIGTLTDKFGMDWIFYHNKNQ
jgi:PhnB protein